MIGDLLWKPFDLRFGDLLEQMGEHQRALFQEMYIWSSKAASYEWARIASERKDNSRERDRSEEERQEAAKERELAKEERRLMTAERQESADARQHTTQLLAEVREEMRALGKGRTGQSWLYPLHSVILIQPCSREKFPNHSNMDLAT